MSKTKQNPDLDDIIAEGDELFGKHGERLVEQGEWLERGIRAEDAGVLSRSHLPGWLQEKAGALRLRIKHPDLEHGAMAWEWGQNLLLLGKTGIGKTNALALLWRRLLCQAVWIGGREWQRARGMVWVRAVELAEARRKHPLGREVPAIKAAREATLLFLDDIDANEAAREEVWKIIAYRYDQPSCTAMTTGLDRDELRNVFGAPVVRKMIQACGRKALVVDTFVPPPKPITGTPEPDGKSAAAGGV